MDFSVRLILFMNNDPLALPLERGDCTIRDK